MANKFLLFLSISYDYKLSSKFTRRSDIKITTFADYLCTKVPLLPFFFYPAPFCGWVYTGSQYWMFFLFHFIFHSSFYSLHNVTDVEICGIELNTVVKVNDNDFLTASFEKFSSFISTLKKKNKKHFRVWFWSVLRCSFIALNRSNRDRIMLLLILFVIMYFVLFFFFILKWKWKVNVAWNTVSLRITFKTLEALKFYTFCCFYFWFLNSSFFIFFIE